MAFATRPPAPESRVEHDDIIVLPGFTWADYERLLEIRGDRSGPRITYLEGLVEIISPSRPHEGIKSRIGCLVEAWCFEHEIEFSAYGSWTLQDERAERGAEPDECYVFGEVAEPERPDLAIEVVWTRGGIEKLEVYRMLHVREVWIWDKGQLTPYALRGQRYRATKKSHVLPGIDLGQLTGFIDRPTTSRAVLDYRAALRATPR